MCVAVYVCVCSCVCVRARNKSLLKKDRGMGNYYRQLSKRLKLDHNHTPQQSGQRSLVKIKMHAGEKLIEFHPGPQTMVYTVSISLYVCMYALWMPTACVSKSEYTVSAQGRKRSRQNTGGLILQVMLSFQNRFKNQVLNVMTCVFSFVSLSSNDGGEVVATQLQPPEMD